MLTLGLGENLDWIWAERAGLAFVGWLRPTCVLLLLLAVVAAGCIAIVRAAIGTKSNAPPVARASGLRDAVTA